MELFVTCGPHLEPLLQAELAELGYESRAAFRGAYVNCHDLSAVYKINYCSRIASRVLLPLKKFRVGHAEELYKSVKEINWEPFFKVAKTMAVDANVEHPRLRNSLFAAQVVKDAVCDQLVERRGTRPSVDTYQPDVQLNLFIRGDTGVLSFDTSGSPLHKRGYRVEGGIAPMHETLAAALLRIADYKPEDILIDTCAGSGTILIEAMMIASKTAPGAYRTKYGFMLLPEYSESDWLNFKASVDAERIPLMPGHFVGIELNKNSYRICLTHLKALGFHREAEIHQGDFKDFAPAVAPTLLVTNPPWGKRIEEIHTLVPLYRSLGEFMKREMAKPARGFVFTGSLELAKEVGLASKKRTVLDNGGIEARLLEFEIY